MGNDYGKTRLYSPIRSKTTAFLRCAHHHSAQQECSSPPRRGDESAGKRSHRNHSSSPERVRLLQPLLLHPQKSQRSATYSRSQTPELRPDEKVVQDDHFETDPPANMPRGLVHVAVSERCILSHPGSPHHRRIRNVSCAANQHIRMISEGSCDAEDCSNDAENSALHHRNKLNLLAIYQNKKLLFSILLFLLDL